MTGMMCPSYDPVYKTVTWTQVLRKSTGFPIYQSKLYKYPKNQQVHQTLLLQSLLVLLEIHRSGPVDWP